MEAMSSQHSAISGRQARNLAAGLGWFSIGLGLVEVLAPGRLTKSLGMQGKERLLQLYGIREIANGIGVLSAKSAPWLWGRVAGDALDIASLLPYANEDNPKKTNARVALVAVAAVTSLDVACANAMSSQTPQRSQGQLEYSHRSGFPRGLESARGAARDYIAPDDMRAPELMRPWQ
jgi:hypothetical protein